MEKYYLVTDKDENTGLSTLLELGSEESINTLANKIKASGKVTVVSPEASKKLFYEVEALGWISAALDYFHLHKTKDNIGNKVRGGLIKAKIDGVDTTLMTLTFYKKSLNELLSDITKEEKVKETISSIQSFMDTRSSV